MTDPVATHVAELERVLRGPARARRSMITEARDGLWDAAEVHRRNGLDPRDAAARAVREFGPVREIAPLYQEELTARQGRRTAVLLAVAFPGLLLGWDLLWTSGVAWTGPASTLVRVMIRTQDTASGVVAVAALALLALTFRTRGSARQVSAAVGLTGALGAVVCGGTAVVMNLANAQAAAGMLATSPFAVIALAVSGLVLVLVVRSTARTLRTALLS